MANDPVDHVTDAEKAAGFELQDVEYFEPGDDKPQTRRYVCALIDDSNRVVKVANPVGQIQYRHERRGLWGFQKADSPVRWLPVFDPQFDPGVAVATATVNKDKQSDPKTIW